jgi:hypothetical protein
VFIVLGIYNFDKKAEICPLSSMGFHVAPWGYTVLGTSEISFDKRFLRQKKSTILFEKNCIPPKYLNKFILTFYV